MKTTTSYEMNATIQTVLTQRGKRNSVNLQLLKQYTGYGGQRHVGIERGIGSLYEYYTPENVIKLCWHLVNEHLTLTKENIRVLEPSCGKGDFFAPVSNNPKYRLYGIEIDEISSMIARRFYPQAKIVLGSFEGLFIENQTPTNYNGELFDIVIGNPPYGIYESEYKTLGEGKSFTYYEEYFVKRGLDLLNEGGILAMVLPKRFMKWWTREEKREIAQESELLTAYRLPRYTFSRTKMGTDIVILRRKRQNKPNIQTFKLYYNKHPHHILGKVTYEIGKGGRKEEIVIADPMRSVATVLAEKSIA